MSKNDMVMVPKEPTDEMKEAADGLGFIFITGDEEWNGIISADMAEEIYQTMIEAAPSQQHHSEPVALPKRLPTHRIDSNGWNACLDEIAKLGPLYPGPVRDDTDEIEILRYELARTRKHHDEYVKASEDIRTTLLSADDRYKGELQKLRIDAAGLAVTVEGLRAQLAERDALLREVLEAFQLEPDGSCINPGRDFIRPWAAKLATLSASAEPSAMAKRIKSAACPECASNPCMCADLSAQSVHPINMKTMMRAYEQVDNKALLHGTSNWCSAMATTLRGVLAAENDQIEYELAGYEGSAGLYYSKRAAVANGEQRIEPIYRVKK